MKGKVYLLVELNSHPIKYKIGITRGDVKKRLKSLQTGSSNELIVLNLFESDHYLYIEKYLHKIYSEYSTEGGKEWFELPDEIVPNFKQECLNIENRILNLIQSGNPFF